jgi:hypothetical protein
MMGLVLIVAWLVAWIVPVVVLFRKDQAAWAMTGILFGWAFALPWIVAAITTKDKKKEAAARRAAQMEGQRHTQMLEALTIAALPAGTRSVEDRLATLDELLFGETITADEYQARRTAIINGI